VTKDEKPAELPTVNPPGVTLLPGAPPPTKAKRGAAEVTHYQQLAQRLIDDGIALRARLAGADRPKDSELEAYFARSIRFSDVVRERMLEYDSENTVRNDLGKLLEETNLKLTELRTHLGGS